MVFYTHAAVPNPISAVKAPQDDTTCGAFLSIGSAGEGAVSGEGTGDGALVDAEGLGDLGRGPWLVAGV